MFWDIAALIEITQMWKNRILEFAKRRGDKLLEIGALISAFE